MHRFYLDDVVEWLARENPRPLVLRGSRQVGKTWLIRELARQSHRDLAELNFERNPEVSQLFEPKGPVEIHRGIEALTSRAFGRTPRSSS